MTIDFRMATSLLSLSLLEPADDGV